jgi:hypothetical protein
VTPGEPAPFVVTSVTADAIDVTSFRGPREWITGPVWVTAERGRESVRIEVTGWDPIPTPGERVHVVVAAHQPKML